MSAYFKADSESFRSLDIYDKVDSSTLMRAIEEVCWYISVVKVVAVNRSAVQAYKKARETFPKQEIATFCMLTE